MSRSIRKTGDISDLRRPGDTTSFAKTDAAGLNKYVYLAGSNVADVQSSGAASITVIDKGPLVVRVKVESPAPGCNGLARQYTLTAGADHLEIANTVDKKRVTLNPHPEDRKASTAFAQHESKESVSFAYGFNVPDGQIHIDAPLAIVRPEIDQIPGACKDWLPVGRWIDVSNEKTGITLATLDAPLVELGQLSTLLGSQRNPDVWRHKIEPTQLIYSWAMNNHWGTNYRAYQQGPVTFRYALRPHDEYDPAEATEFATRLSQPLMVFPAGASAPTQTPLIQVEPASITVTALKPSEDHRGWIVRLFNPTEHHALAKLHIPPGKRIFISDLSESAGQPLSADQISLPSMGLMTIRIE